MSTLASDGTTSTGTTAIAAAIFGRLQEGWNRADGAAWAAEFADENDFVNIHGTHYHGDGADVGRNHQAIFDTIYAGSSVHYQVCVAREVTPRCIVAVVESTLTAPSGPLQGIHTARITVVITEQRGRWVITAFQNTLVRS